MFSLSFCRSQIWIYLQKELEERSCPKWTYQNPCVRQRVKISPWQAHVLSAFLLHLKIQHFWKQLTRNLCLQTTWMTINVRSNSSPYFPCFSSSRRGIRVSRNQCQCPYSKSRLTSSCLVQRLLKIFAINSEEDHLFERPGHDKMCVLSAPEDA